ncbi:MAG TPA: Gfo/Idh/MocA family oxidoreductase [bacterium]|nr:Gfo/Idh/MocA family oxidoreductase [Candidatus Omnitrophota bacterium]HOL95347.1 Gfo/Idh/MocA family oxidoreductase [bacterium]HPP02935.1 Gfo/Idh/MocA family oxidoreductase [bacterium]HXK92142.1 Gfo/Idh/MocA family oxidoreductase [bacterium]
MMKQNEIKRRTFLRTSGGAGLAAWAAPMLVTSRVWGANDTIGLGIIGPGRRGQQLMGDFNRLKGCRFVAVSDVNARRMDQVAVGKDWKKCQDFRALLELKEVDAVIVATPDHWHALNSIYACMAGKDVYVEKPMTLTIAEGRAMVNAARHYNCVVQCGSQQRSDARCRTGCEWVRNQRAGKVTVVHTDNYPSPWEQPFPVQPVPEGLDWDTWLGPTQERGYHEDIYTPRAKPGWISILPYSGGEVTGWGAHGLDMIQWALGMDETGPVEIWPEGPTRSLDRPVTMRYASGVLLKLDNQGPAGGGWFECEKGTILVDRGVCKIDPPELEKETSASPSEIHLEISTNHQQNFLDCVRSRKRPIADVEVGHRSTTVCHLVNIARWTCRKLQWDPKQELFAGDDDANHYLDRPRRPPWELPKIG